MKLEPRDYRVSHLRAEVKDSFWLRGLIMYIMTGSSFRRTGLKLHSDQIASENHNEEKDCVTFRVNCRIVWPQNSQGWDSCRYST